jgi:hypothetical protein
MKQLDLFNIEKKRFFNGLVFQNGIKNADFVVFNPLNKKLVDEKPFLFEIKLKESSFWSDIKSMVWSSNCRFFFFINENNIVIGNTHDNEGFVCMNLSMNVFKEFQKTFALTNKK